MIATQPIFCPQIPPKSAVTLLLQCDFCKISMFRGILPKSRDGSCRSFFDEKGCFGPILAFCDFLSDLPFYCYIFLLKVIKAILYKGLRCCNRKTQCAKKRKFKGVLLQTVTPLLQNNV